MSTFSLSRVLVQLKALPLRLKIWLLWLIASTLVIPLLFISNEFFSAMLICQVGNLVFGTFLMLRYGLVKLLSLSHIIFWTPMLAKFGWYYNSLDSSLLLWLGWVVIGSVAASLVLDFRDYREWLRGDRAPIVKV